jgi:conjugal transfer pilus assembly protein TraB
MSEVPAKNIKQKQMLIAAGIIGTFFLASTAWVISDTKKKEAEQVIPKKKIEVAKLAGGISAEEKWLQNAEEELKALGTEVKNQKEGKEELEEKVKALEGIIEVYERQKAERGEETSLSDELLKLREEIESLKNNQVPNTVTSDGQIKRRIIKTLEINLDGNTLSIQQGPKYKLDYYLPAGSYAKATLISGIDASVGVSSQSDPRPVLLRVTSQAKTAANEALIQKVDLVGCTVTGAASGDLSSERVFIRLVKMTCSREDGQVFESNVHGYVSSQGKAGIRGEVVSREGDFVTKSFIAGIASGFGEGISQRLTPSTSFFSSNGNEPSTKDVLGRGLGQGTQNASQRLSDYLIQRAEQYQPVVSVPSGIEAEIVLSDGLYIDGRKNANIKEGS